MAYLLDSNVFIEAVQRYYRPSICPGFWHWLDRNTVKIPDVCDGVGISWIKPFDMLEREGVRLVLG